MPIGSTRYDEIVWLWQEESKIPIPDYGKTKASDYGSRLIMARRKAKDETKNEQHNTKNNVQGLLLYHPVLLNSPWEAPDDLDEQIAKLLLTT